MTNLPEIQVDELQEESFPFRYSITSYGADFDVDGLVRRIQRGDVYVPSFQRGYVWDIVQASRFIESLLLGLPVPGIFLAKDALSEQYIVIDGQQRLYSLLFFFQGKFADGKEFILKGVAPQYNGLSYNTLRPEDRRRLENAILHATIVRQDEPDDGSSSVYLLFERLNTGGVKLQPQEIRSALYHGKLSALLDHLNLLETWRSIYGTISPRLRDEELILRFLALYFTENQYSKPMTSFLNRFISMNRNLETISAEDMTHIFIVTINTIQQCIGNRAFKRKSSLNAAIFDAVMVGLARRLSNSSIEDCNALKEQYESLIDNDEFITVTNTATADEENVHKRISIATSAFASLK